MNDNKGFTLIELMIVVSIIGILAAFAGTLYPDYVSRSQMNRGLGELGALRTSIEETLMRGVDPSTVTLDELGYTDSNLFDTPPEITMDNSELTLLGIFDGNVSNSIDSASLEWNRSAAGVWTCVINDNGAAGFKTMFVPEACEYDNN